MGYEKTSICLLLIFCVTLTLILPFMRYVAVGWRARRKDIMDGLNADARHDYFAMFSRSDKTPPKADAGIAFEALYAHWYGRRFFILPGFLLLLLGLLVSTACILTALDWIKCISNPLCDIPAPAVAALAGAYLWVVNDHISRTRRLDFAPSDVHWGVLRLVVAVPMGYAFTALAKNDVANFIAFALGAFPLTALTALLRRIATKSLGAEATEDEASDDAISLQGVNKAILERLSDEDVTTVTQIAYCDPVRLTMRSNLAFNFVIDLMNQALAWMYLQSDLDIVRPLGMRGACEIKNLIDDYDRDANTGTDAEKAAHTLAVVALPQIAAALKQTPDTLQVVFRQIAGDPYTIFLNSIWT